MTEVNSRLDKAEKKTNKLEDKSIKSNEMENQRKWMKHTKNGKNNMWAVVNKIYHPCEQIPRRKRENGADTLSEEISKTDVGHQTTHSKKSLQMSNRMNTEKTIHRHSIVKLMKNKDSFHMEPSGE